MKKEGKGNQPHITLISGGQTGVDRATLDFALEHGIPCGGYCPKGRKAEDGRIDKKYPLIETNTENYSERTIQNVQQSDGIIVFFDNHIDPGTQFAIDTSRKLCKTCLLVNLATPSNREMIAEWLRKNNITKLNIAGPRESFNPGIYQKVRKVLGHVFLESQK
ncbi:MAG TPA: putative molybdenum carrier protein [Bacteroidales bacterium]|nr:putative molybdenum carrier protein [Bacteroidales bacterium]